MLVSSLVREYDVRTLTASHALHMTATSNNKRTLGIISFDLDDTLFPTSAIINDANQVMLETLQLYGIDVTEEEFLNTIQQIRNYLSEPVTYSFLRKRAIAQLVTQNTEFSGNTPSIVDECFDAWLQERHVAAERHLFPHALNCLSILKQQYPDACIAAITNGRGNPLCMPVLADFFDFCVSGEDDNVFPARKPAPGIYEASLNQYKKLFPHHDSRVWIHVGDCLANDVGASAAVGAYAVWLSDPTTTDATTPNWSTATSGEQDARKLKVAEGREKIAVRISW